MMVTAAVSADGGRTVMQPTGVSSRYATSSR
jgi:hypothetical protein